MFDIQEYNQFIIEFFEALDNCRVPESRLECDHGDFHDEMDACCSELVWRCESDEFPEVFLDYARKLRRQMLWLHWTERFDMS